MRIFIITNVGVKKKKKTKKLLPINAKELVRFLISSLFVKLYKKIF